MDVGEGDPSAAAAVAGATMSPVHARQAGCGEVHLEAGYVTMHLSPDT